jgi:Asp-tRNA(Asn)/Glu-tRNA(Gln) amidotransferase A subunit family amidase
MEWWRNGPRRQSITTPIFHFSIVCSVMDLTNLNWLSATEAARLIRDGVISSEQLVEACLARVREADAQIQAWAFLDADHALAQARAADQLRLLGQPTGPLHGIPVGIKDIFDTADMPTEHGSVLHAGRTPSRDATAVARLRAAGAVIMGKTVTTEFAYFSPGKTRNPHHPEHTPGGSSSGSAASVAANMIPLALGSQTNGSTIRPAAYCGVVGFKPTHGLISRQGSLTLSRTLDHVGLFARTIDDIALLAAELVGYDERDLDTRPRARIPFVEVAAEEPPLSPMFAFVKTPHWERADEDTKQGFAELVEQLGEQVEEVELFLSAAAAWEWHRTIMEAEMSANLEREWDKGRNRLSEQLRAQLERGRNVRAIDYQRALSRIAPIHESFVGLFEQRYDAILTPAATGAAPKGLSSTGDPIFCTLWTLCGMPAISLPLLQGANGLPLGVQLVGPRNGDARLLRTARWLAAQVAAGG